MNILFSYDDLWRIYLAALAVFSLSCYLILKPLPWIWCRWVLVVSLTVVLATSVHVTEGGWMVPGLIYWLFEHFIVKSEGSQALLNPLLINLAVAFVITTLLWVAFRLLSPDKVSSFSKSTKLNKEA